PSAEGAALAAGPAGRGLSRCGRGLLALAQPSAARGRSEPGVRVAGPAPAELGAVLADPEGGDAAIVRSRADEREAAVLAQLLREVGQQRDALVDGQRRALLAA